MRNSDILQIVTDARENHGFISIVRYRSKSGRIANLIVQPFGPNGYVNMVSKAIEQVTNGNIEKPSTVSQEIWNQAISEQVESWRKTLSEEGHGRKNNFKKEAKGFYSKKDDDAVYVRHVMVIKKEIIEEGEIPVINSKPLTIAKKLLVGQTVLSKYEGSFKLDPTKFDKITFNRNVIET